MNRYKYTPEIIPNELAFQIFDVYVKQNVIYIHVALSKINIAINLTTYKPMINKCFVKVYKYFMPQNNDDVMIGCKICFC